MELLHSAPHISDDEARQSNHAPPSSFGSDLPDTYEVVWLEGTALGLTLRVHPTTRLPVVARVIGTTDNFENIERVAPGDMLFQANDAPIIPQRKFKQTLENLARLPRPAVLRFRRGSPSVGDDDYFLPQVPALLRDHEYELIWREHSNLGLIFISDGDVPRVSKVDPALGGPSVAVVSVGDTLTCIGPTEIGSVSFHSSMATLRAATRPVVLRFQRSAP